MKCLFGIYKMDAGEIILDGEKVEINNPDEAMKKELPWYIRNCQPVPAKKRCRKICTWEDSRQSVDH